MSQSDTVSKLEQQGVTLICPESIEIAPNVVPEQIQGPDTIIFPGSRLRGAELRVMPGCKIGEEGPATVVDCALANNVSLAGGYFSGAAFLDGASMGLGAHVRAGTVLEEQANGAHTVGLKQTILLPFVTLGSLINFCDILMSGGTSRADHSEVGSSFIHFNFTPHGARGDKATGSLIGDVPRGALLKQSRIFLGGQAGLVGPMEIDFGTVLAAGSVYRRDHGPDQLVVGEPMQTMKTSFRPERYTRVAGRVRKNLKYIGNLIALWHWYQEVRTAHAGDAADRLAVYRFAQSRVASGIAERVKQLGRLAGYMEASIEALESESRRREKEIRTQRRFSEQWPAMAEALADPAKFETAAPCPSELTQAVRGQGYIQAIQALDDRTAAAATGWLESFVAATVGLADGIEQDPKNS